MHVEARALKALHSSYTYVYNDIALKLVQNFLSVLPKLLPALVSSTSSPSNSKLVSILH